MLFDHLQNAEPAVGAADSSSFGVRGPRVAPFQGQGHNTVTNRRAADLVQPKALVGCLWVAGKLRGASSRCKSSGGNCVLWQQVLLHEDTHIVNKLVMGKGSAPGELGGCKTGC